MPPFGVYRDQLLFWPGSTPLEQTLVKRHPAVGTSKSHVSCAHKQRLHDQNVPQPCSSVPMAMVDVERCVRAAGTTYEANSDNDGNELPHAASVASPAGQVG